MSKSEEKSSKVNGVSTDPLVRLASFKPPRDLSLGGVKPNKKVFTPNLNVTRNKNKGTSSNTTRETRKDDKNRKDRRNDRSRNGPNVIKSSGIFSEGVGGSSERHSSWSSYGSREKNTSSELHRPVIRVKNLVKIDKELEEQRIQSIIGGEAHDEEDPGEDFKRVFERDAPIKLPMDETCWIRSGIRNMVVKKELKTEPEESNEQDVKPIVKTEYLEDSDLVDILCTEVPTFILIQLPDSLPGRGGNVDDEYARRKAEEPSSFVDEKDNTTNNRCLLSHLEEGRIGKMLVHRSGRVTFMLGNTEFEVQSGTKPAFAQQVVSVGADAASRSARLVALGSLRHRISVAPMWPYLFTDAPASVV